MYNLGETLDSLRARGEQALIAFIMAGLPGQDQNLACIKAIEQGGCDFLELGVPFSDPVADGEVIERMHHQGVAQGLNLSRIMEYAEKVREATSFPLILFCYYNPILQRGVGRFMREITDIGISAVIIPDLPLEEIEPLKSHGVDIIPMVAPSTSDERLKKAGHLASSFVYCVSVKGVTGVRDLPEKETIDYLARVRTHTACPLALGFGISRPEQIRTFRGFADAVVVGSHLARIMEDISIQPGHLPAALEKEIRLLKSATRNG